RAFPRTQRAVPVDYPASLLPSGSLRARCAAPLTARVPTTNRWVPPPTAQVPRFRNSRDWSTTSVAPTRPPAVAQTSVTLRQSDAQGALVARLSPGGIRPSVTHQPHARQGRQTPTRPCRQRR